MSTIFSSFRYECHVSCVVCSALFFSRVYKKNLTQMDSLSRSYCLSDVAVVWKTFAREPRCYFAILLYFSSYTHRKEISCAALGKSGNMYYRVVYFCL